jgi:hypothetical protein
MARRLQQRKADKARRHGRAGRQPASPPRGDDVRLADRVERLAYTRRQAAEALGVSLTTLDRRVVPAIATIRTEWGARLIPVVELERYLAEWRQEARAGRKRPARPGRKPGLPPEIVSRIRDERARGKSLGEIARRLNSDGVRTSQGGRQWWASTVRGVLIRRSQADTAEASTASLRRPPRAQQRRQRHPYFEISWWGSVPAARPGCHT